MGLFRKSRVWPLIIGGCVILCAGLVVAPIISDARRLAEMSAQLELIKEAEHLLEEYRANHRQYPKSLDALEFTFPDGGDRSTLALLKYESDGETYSLVTDNVYSGEEHRVSR
jgi:hypothetical protein